MIWLRKCEYHKLVGARGFEPPTPWSRTRCSTRLSHAPLSNQTYFLLEESFRPPFQPVYRLTGCPVKLQRGDGDISRINCHVIRVRPVFITRWLHLLIKPKISPASRILIFNNKSPSIVLALPGDSNSFDLIGWYIDIQDQTCRQRIRPESFCKHPGELRSPCKPEVLARH